MTPLIEKYLGIDKVNRFAKQHNYDQISFDELVELLDRNIRDEVMLTKGEYEYEIDDEEEKSLMDFAEDYMSRFVSAKEKGFSLLWAKTFSRKSMGDKEGVALELTYEAGLEQNAFVAIKDLQLYAKSTGKDDLFVKHFAFLVRERLFPSYDTLYTQAIEYSRICKEQIQEGKSAIFANYFSYLMALENQSELRCTAEAAEYEKAILADFPVEYAREFSNSIAEYIDDGYSSYEEFLADPKGKIKSAEFAKQYDYLKYISLQA